MKSYFSIFSTCAIILFTSCSDDKEPVKSVETIKDLKVAETEVSIEVNKTKTIKITSGNGDYKINSNTFVKAVVNNEIIELTALKAGDTKISLTDAKKKTIKITVNIKQAPLYPEKDIILVESGTFKMENKEKGQSQEVTLSSFRISKYEVTNQQYAKFLNKIGADSKGIYNRIEYIWTGLGCDVIYDEKNNKFTAKEGAENKPVVQVTWAGADAYAKEAGGNLPTEAQWEYAARGGKKSKNYTYSGSNNIDDVSWSTNNSGLKIQPIGKKLGNELGIYDMSGNVWEWCSDWYGDYQIGSIKDPKGPNSGELRVNRGGGCKDENTVSARSSLSPQYAYPIVGFRIVFPI